VKIIPVQASIKEVWGMEVPQQGPGDVTLVEVWVLPPKPKSTI